MRNVREGSLLGVFIVLLVASCSTAPAGSSPPAAPQDRYGAPAVTSPRMVGDMAADPCGAALTKSELGELGFDQVGRERPFLGVVECSWNAADGQNLRLYADTSRDLLADTYRTQKTGVFQSTVIDGMPAVRQKSGAGQFNYCTITTGLGPRQALETTWNGLGDPTPDNDACRFAEKATELVIRKLPPQR